MNDTHDDRDALPDGWTRRKILALAGAGAISSYVWSPGRAIAQETPRKGGILKISAPSNPSSLDPATGGAGSDHAILWTMFDTLVEWDYDTLQPKPGMAEWAFPEPTTMVLKIKPGIQFHDGTPMDAQAVKFNLDRNRTDARSNIKAELVNVTEVEVTGPLEVKLKLKQPDAALPAILSDRSGMMASPKAVTALGAEHDRKPVGAGPWKFVSWADNQSVVVTRHDQYWQEGKPYLDGVEIAIIPELATGLRSVIAGQRNLAYHLAPRLKPVIDRAKNVKLVTGPTLYCFQIYFNYGKGPLTDVRIRQAINYAIDRDAYVKGAMSGFGEPARMNLPEQHWAYAKSVAGLYPYDPDKAKKLLAEAGVAGGLDLTFGGYTDQDSVRRAEIVMDHLGKVGIRAKFTNGTVAEISGQFFGAEKKFDALLSAWTGRPDPSMSFSLMYAKDAYYNAGRAEVSPELSRLLVESRAKEDLGFRKEVFEKIQRIVMEQALVAPLAFNQEMNALGQDVRGFRSNLLGKPKFREVWLAA